MLSLRELQLRFAAALAGEVTASATRSRESSEAARDVGMPEARLAIYRANGRANYRNALAATFPVVKRLTGAAFFNAAVDAFVAVHPPVSGDLNVYGERLAEFLERYPHATSLQYLSDVARLEWAIDEANRAADTPRVPDAVLAAFSLVAAERVAGIRVALAASCRIVASAYPILHIWRANQPDRAGDERIALDEGGVALLLRRDADGVAMEALGAGEFAWLAALAGRATLGEAIDRALAAEAAFDLGAALRAHIAAGTIAAVTDR